MGCITNRTLTIPALTAFQTSKTAFLSGGRGRHSPEGRTVCGKSLHVGLAGGGAANTSAQRLPLAWMDGRKPEAAAGLVKKQGQTFCSIAQP